MKKFSLVKYIRLFSNLVEINFAWLISSLMIVTLIPSTTVLINQVIDLLYKKDTYQINYKDYFKEVIFLTKENKGRAISYLISGIPLAITIILYILVGKIVYPTFLTILYTYFLICVTFLLIRCGSQLYQKGKKDTFIQLCATTFVYPEFLLRLIIKWLAYGVLAFMYPKLIIFILCSVPIYMTLKELSLHQYKLNMFMKEMSRKKVN
ncbi:hypothetical protein P7H75_02550 [Vagococcus carniphilus]|uniref:hypothetical protein n=1 Tax=Vagococcus carniphilus TaxID=218144 RepID=UPI00288EFD14|nr:hypothetical protein [Vagococcus carniphilus]MDT2813714.1 hypothetical protein [Vagococcus carniphilus]